MELRNKTIVFIATVAWQRNWQRQQEWAKRLAEHNRVLYVAPYGMTSMGPLTVLKKFRAQKGFTYEHKLSERVTKNLEHVRLVFAPIRNIRLLNAINARWMERQLRQLGVTDDPDTIFWTCNPADTTVSLLKRYPKSRAIFDIAMRFSLLLDAPKWITKSQAQLAARADAIIYDAKAHLLDLPTETHYKATYIPQGFTYASLVTKLEEHPRVAAIPHPRAVYIGLDTVLDVALIKRLLQDLSELHIIMIGDVDPQSLVHPRLHWLGPVNTDQKDHYMFGSDVALIPYKVSDYTAGTFPTKFFEYRALGLPVVSTDLAELRQFEPQVAIGKTHAEFVEKVRAVLAGVSERHDSGSTKITVPHDFLAEHTWDKRFALVSKVMETL